MAEVGLFFHLSTVSQTGGTRPASLKGCFIPLSSYFKYFCSNTINIHKECFKLYVSIDLLI